MSSELDSGSESESLSASDRRPSTTVGWVVVELLEPMVLPVATIHEPETEAESPSSTT